MELETPHFRLSAYAIGDKNAPRLALLLPGYLDTKDYPDMRRAAEYLADRGYYAVSFDAPGTWESGGDIADYTISNYLRAVDEVIAHFGNRPTLLMGKSMGGLVAQLAAARNTHVVATVAVVSPPKVASEQDGQLQAVGKPAAAWQSSGTAHSERDLPGDPAQFRTFDVPYSFVEDASQYDTTSAVTELHIPKLFIAAEHDTLARSELVRHLYELAAEPKQFKLLPDAEHDYRRQPRSVEQVNHFVGEFLDTCSL